MKKAFVLILLTINVKLFCQSVDPCEAHRPKSEISLSESNKRVKIYKSKKNPELLSQIGRKEIESISYTRDAFVNLLREFAKPSADYDGFRVYYATYPVFQSSPPAGLDSGYKYVPPGEGKSDCFTLIFVPTTKGVNAAGKPIHNDKLDQCFIYDGADFVPKDAATDKFLRSWIMKYRQLRMPIFDKHGNGRLNKGVFSFTHVQRFFYETESLWYSISHVVNKEQKGLLDFLICKEKQITLVSANFAGYRRKANEGDYDKFRTGPENLRVSRQPKYQLTLIFKFIGPGAGGNKSRLALVFADTETATDTAKPCPPPNEQGACNTEGATLGAQQ